MGQNFIYKRSGIYIKFLIFAFILNILVLSTVYAARDYSVSLNGGMALATRNSGSPPWFGMGPAFQLGVNIPLKANWRIEAGILSYRMYDNTSTSSEFSLGSDESSRTRSLKGIDFSVLFRHYWFPFGSKIGLNGGIGVGLSNWRIADPVTDLTLVTSSERGGAAEYKASELFLSTAAGMDYQLNANWKINLDIRTNYLTGAGLEFDKAVEDSLGNWNLSAGLSLSYLFGGKKSKARWEKIRQRPYTPRENIIKTDSLPTPEAFKSRLTKLDNANDSDNDGIPDEDDRCPDTPSQAAGYIDIFGCPVDSDADGYPDYSDRCPHNPRGALVDNSGCPIDSDKDGVPDGLDDCPNSDPNLKIDKHGCVDISFINKPMILNIKYRANSFEIDHFSKLKLDSIFVLLEQAPMVSVEVIGYTDNIGTALYNKNLSQRRANRVRDYLVNLGMDRNRIVANGAGGTNFIASNETEAGRQANRRIVLVFTRQTD